MLSKRTVFVLGAGASQPYGFPLGWRLRYEVCMEALRPGDELIAMGCNADAVHQRRIDLARSWATSIDQFIATRGDEDMLVRKAVALTLCKYESDDGLFFAERGDWFRYLWSHLATEDPLKFPTESLSFITLNYERSLEHAFWNAFKHSYIKAPADIKDRMPTIIHVYGTLGDYPGLSDKPGRPFGFQPTKENIEAAASEIKAISDANREAEHLQKARTLLNKAEQIVFLGCAYDERTLGLLDFTPDGHKSLDPNCLVYGTIKGLGAGEVVRARGCLRNCGEPGLAAAPILEDAGDRDCLEYLRFKRSHIFG